MKSAKANVSIAHLALRSAARKADRRGGVGQVARVALLLALAHLFFCGASVF